MPALSALQSARRSRRWRRIRRLLLAVALLVLSALIALVFVVRRLDNPSVKRHVLALAHSTAGVDIDYGATEVRVLSGLRITDLVVRTPPRFSGLAPEMVRLGTLDLGWTLAGLLGRRPLLTHVEARDLTVTLLTEPDGATSLSELGSGEKKPAAKESAAKESAAKESAKKESGTSHLASELLHGAPLFEHLVLERVTLHLLQLDPHHAVTALHLTGVGLTLDTARAAAGWQFQASTGATPAVLSLRREHKGVTTDELDAELKLDAAVSPTDAQASAQVRVLKQTVEPTFKLDKLLTLQAQAHFDKKAGRTDLSVQNLIVADGAATAVASGELYDAPGKPPLLTFARGTVNLEPILRIVPTDLLPVTARRAELRFDVGPLVLAGMPRLVPGGHADVDGDIETLNVALSGGQEDLALGEAKISLKAEPTAEQGTALKVQVPIKGLKLTRPGELLEGAAVTLMASGQLDAAGAVTGEAALQFSGLSRVLSTPGAPSPERMALRDGHITVKASELRLELSAAPALPAHPAPAAEAAPPPNAVPPAETATGPNEPRGPSGPGEPNAPAGPAGPAGPHGPHGHGQPVGSLHGKLLASLKPHPKKRVVHAYLTVGGQLDGLSLLRPGQRVELESLGISANSQLSGGAPYGFDIDLPLRGLRVLDDKGHTLLNGPAHLSAHAAEIFPHPGEERRVRGAVKLALEVGVEKVQLELRKHEEKLDFDLTAAAGSLVDVHSFVTASGFEIPWERVAVSLHTQGQVEHLFSAAPLVSQHAELRVEHPEFKSATGSFVAQGLALVATTSGTARSHNADLDLKVNGLNVNGNPLDDVHLTLSGAADADAPSLRLRLGSEAKTGLSAAWAATLGFDRRKKTLSYDVSAKVAKLTPLQPFLAKVHAAHGIDLSTLELSLGSRGTVTGLVEGISSDLVVRRAAHPLETMNVDGTIDMSVAGLYWADDNGERVVKSPQMSLVGKLGHDGEGRKLHADLALDGLHLEFGDHELDFGKLKDALDLTVIGDMTKGEFQVAQQMSLSDLQQDFALGYALSGIELSLKAWHNHDGELRIDELRLANAGGGTGLDLKGHLDLGAERRSLSLAGTLDQKLDKLWNRSEVFRGRGDLALNVQLDSGDFSLFHTEAGVFVSDGSITLPRSGITIDGVVGEVPIVMDFVLNHSGLHPPHGAIGNVYSELRYADQHPMLSGRSFISVKSIVTPLFSVAGLAGNLRIYQNLVSLNQFELGLRGGQVSGQCLVDFKDEGPKVRLRLRASRIETSHHERFDGNAALVVDVRDHSVEGRSEILRIGRNSLLSLLDLQDPQRTDPGANRIRHALSLGYPERLSLSFNHGFARAEIVLGGLAGLVRIDPLVGIPMGPIIDKLYPHSAKTEDE